MANNIDRRVVEMEFNNTQFERGVRTSTSSLESLKKALDFTGISKSSDMDAVVSNVERTATEFEKFKSHIPNSVKVAGKALVSFGAVATTTCAGIMTAIGGLAIKGGITRAMNLKQADFMLQGLVKDEKQVSKIMENVNASVDGTAYSLDQAALVASQFAATGMRGGQEMENALKGVAGAAAVFGADYQRIGQIFTQVSGQGRLMGNDLLQLSSYGMNAAATLAQYFREVKKEAGTTEADIRDMVSKGKIDFQTFAEAMNWAFGDQAAKANETFTGALSNLKSAFSRIGEKIASPVIDSLRDLFNSIRPLVNALNKQITPALEAFGTKIGSISGKVTKFIDKLGGSEKVTSKFLSELDFDSYGELVSYLKKVKKGSIEASEDVEKLAKSFKNSNEITKESVEDLVKSKKITFEILKKSSDEAAKSITATTSDLEKYSTKDKKASKVLAQYFNEVNKGNIKTSKTIKQTIKDLTDGKEITAKTARELVEQEKISYEILGSALGKNIWEKPLHDLSIFGLAIRGLKNIAWNLKYVFDQIKGSFQEVFPTITITRIREAIEAFNSFTLQSRLSDQTLDNLKSTFKGIFTVIKAFGSALKGAYIIISPFLKALVSLAGVFISLTGRIGDFIVKLDSIIRKSTLLKGIFTAIKTLFSGIGEVIKSIGDGFSSVFSNKVFDKSFGEHFKGLGNNFKSFGNSVKNVTKSILPGLESVFSNLGSKLGGLKKNLKGVFTKDGISALTDLVNSGLIGANTLAMKKFFDTLTKSTKDFGSIKDGVVGILDGVKGCLTAYQNDLKADALIKIAKAIAILTASVLVLSLINPKNLATGLAGLTGLFIALFGTIAAFSKVMSGSAFSVGQLMKLAAGLIGISIAVSILSGSLFLISSLSTDQIINGLIGIAGACFILVKVADQLGKAEHGMIKGASSFVIFAAALLIISQAIKILGNLNPEQLLSGLLAAMVVLASLTLFLNNTKFDKFKTSSAAGIFILASALLALTAAVGVLGSMELTTLAKGIASLGVMLAMLAGFTQILAKEIGPMLRMSVGLIAIGIALSLFIAQISYLGRMKPESLMQGIIGLGSMLAMLAIALQAMPDGGSLYGKVMSIYVLAKMMDSLAGALSKVAGIPFKDMLVGLAGLSLGLAMIVASLYALQKIKLTNIAVAQETFAFFNYILKTLTINLVRLSKLSFGQIAQGLLGLAGSMAIIVGSLAVFGKIKGSTLGASVAILAMSAAIGMLAPALKILGSIPLIGIAAALGAIAGVFTILGLAGLLLKPVIVPLIGLAGAILSLGLATAAAGVGVSMFASALATLALLSADSIKNIVSNIIALSKAIPAIFGAIGEGIVEMVRVLGENAIQLAAVGATLIIALLSAINDRMYEVVNLGIQICVNFINGVADNIPLIISAGINLMVQFINGMANGIRENQDLIFTAVGNLMGAIINFVLSAFQILLGEIPIVGDNISAGIETIKGKVDDKLNPKDASDQMQKYTEGYGAGVEKGGKKAKKSAEKMSGEVVKSALKKDAQDKMGEAGKKLGEAYTKKLDKYSKNAEKYGKKFPLNAAKGADDDKPISKAGEKLGDSFTKSLSKKADSAKKAGNELANKAKSGAESVHGFNDAGLNAAQGFVNGASSKGSAAWTAGWNLAGSFENAIRARLKEKSPSRVTHKDGYYAIRGFVDGISDNLKLSKEAGSSIAISMRDALKDSSREIKMGVESLNFIPNQPVIKPVVDLSGVRSASKDINSIFGGTRSIAAAANISNSMQNRSVMNEMTKLVDKIDKFAKQNASVNPNYFTFNVSGSENPEVFANRVSRQLEMEMRAR